MLATILFIAFWVVLAFSLFFIAARGGMGGVRAAFQTQSRGGRKGFGVAFTAIFAVFAIALPVIFIAGNHSKAGAQVNGIKLSKDEKTGRELFGRWCGVCHTLSEANATGKVGPNLDQLKPPYNLVLNTVNNGCLPNAPANSSQQCLGQGVMPANILQGKDAQDVAHFVSKVAGKE
jgi:mono/diheme cytochrome c family protein